MERVVAKSYDDNENVLAVPCEKPEKNSFRNIVVCAFPSRARFPVKIICGIAFGSR